MTLRHYLIGVAVEVERKTNGTFFNPFLVLAMALNEHIIVHELYIQREGRKFIEICKVGGKGRDRN